MADNEEYPSHVSVLDGSGGKYYCALLAWNKREERWVPSRWTRDFKHKTDADKKAKEMAELWGVEVK